VCSELCSYCWRDKQTHRTVIWQKEGGFVSNDRQHRNTVQARDSSRCSTVGVSSCTALITVTGSRFIGANISKFILRRKNIQLYRDCKALCEDRNRPLVSFARYRKIFNCEIYVEFFKQNNDRCHVCEYHKVHHIEFCFKTSYRNCECECVNVTWSCARLCLELFQSVQLKKGIFWLSSNFHKRTIIFSSCKIINQPHSDFVS